MREFIPCVCFVHLWEEVEALVLLSPGRARDYPVMEIVPNPNKSQALRTLCPGKVAILGPRGLAPWRRATPGIAILVFAYSSLLEHM